MIVGVVFGYKGVLLLFGILLAYETRNIKVKHVNDSRFVGMSIYNVVVRTIMIMVAIVMVIMMMIYSFELGLLEQGLHACLSVCLHVWLYISICLSV